MQAIIKTGGKQYRVTVGEKINVEKLDLDLGAQLELASLAVISDSPVFGANAAKTKVKLEVLSHGRGKKIYIDKYKSGIQYRRRRGHRQDYTELKVVSIQ